MPIRDILLLLCGLIALVIASQSSLAQEKAPREETTIADFEDVEAVPTVWAVNIPEQNASLAITTDDPREGARCLKANYKFVSEGSYQYIGISVPVRISHPFDSLSLDVRGDNSQGQFRIQLIDSSGETHQRFSDNFGGKVDFTGWKQLVFSRFDRPHESWGGDGNGTIDYPITKVNLLLAQPTSTEGLIAAEGEVSFDRLSVGIAAHGPAAGVVSVLSPDYGGDIRGDTQLNLRAPGFETLSVRCWKPGERLGQDSVVGTIEVDDEGAASIEFPADEYAHGPITVRISGKSDTSSDNCYLQLYNTGGIRWQEGLPDQPPPAARGMRLVFADDFDGPLSISRNGRGAVYASHKIGGGDFSGIPFGNHEDEQSTPFAQRDTWLRIRADQAANTTGLIASIDETGEGITARAPCYFECRFIAQSAPGTWPAFWVITNYMAKHDGSTAPLKIPQDELDVIEAYGGEGPGNPNQTGYWIATHWWNQGPDGGPDKTQPGFYGQIPMTTLEGGSGATWWESPHVYGVHVGRDETVYFCDNIEVTRHKTSRLSGSEPLFFYINLAIGGASGWKTDLSRYDGIADMYVDYVRVYSQ